MERNYNTRWGYNVSKSQMSCLIRHQILPDYNFYATKVEVKPSQKAWWSRQGREPFHQPARQPDQVQQNPLSLFQALAP